MRCLLGLVGVLLGKLLGDEPVVLFDERLGPLLEVLTVLRGPPVLQTSVAVVLGALVVESVADLMTDDRSDASVVDGIVGFRIEEGRLQDGCREDNDIQGGLIVGVDRLRVHQPLFLVHRLAGLAELITGLVEVGPPHVVDQAQLLVHSQGRVVAPVLGVADLGREFVQLGQSLDLGLFA